jgi:hypothetical protein
VLFGEAFEYQQTVPFFSLFMATLRADPPVGDAEALRRLGSSADLRYWVVHDLQDAIHAAAAETPLAIVLEDVHWADNGTLLALRSLATARPDVAVLWVLTARTGAGGPAVQETLSVLQRADAAVLRVAAAAVGAQLAAPDRPVVALMGDGSMHYAITALWTAAHYRIPLTIVVASNAEYGVLKEFGKWEKTAGVPGLDLPGLNVVGTAASYGVDAHEAHTTDEVIKLVESGIADRERPTLINARTIPVDA